MGNKREHYRLYEIKQIDSFETSRDCGAVHAFEIWSLLFFSR